jgi:hypothetical protein
MVRPTRSLVVTNRHIGRAPGECKLMKTEPLSVQIIGKSGFALCEAAGRWLTLEPPPGLRVGWARPADLARRCRAFNRKAPSRYGLPRNRASIVRNPGHFTASAAWQARSYATAKKSQIRLSPGRMTGPALQRLAF